MGQQIHELVARLLITDVDDQRLRQVQVTEVDVSPNLRNARVYYTVMGLDTSVEDREVRDALKGVVGWIKSHIASELSLKYVPDVEFRFDEALMRGRRIDDLLAGKDDD